MQNKTLKPRSYTDRLSTVRNRKETKYLKRSFKNVLVLSVMKHWYFLLKRLINDNLVYSYFVILVSGEFLIKQRFK